MGEILGDSQIRSMKLYNYWANPFYVSPENLISTLTLSKRSLDFHFNVWLWSRGNTFIRDALKKEKAKGSRLFYQSTQGTGILWGKEEFFDYMPQNNPYGDLKTDQAKIPFIIEEFKFCHKEGTP